MAREVVGLEGVELWGDEEPAGVWAENGWISPAAG